MDSVQSEGVASHNTAGISQVDRQKPLKTSPEEDTDMILIQDKDDPQPQGPMKTLHDRPATKAESERDSSFLASEHGTFSAKTV